MGRSMFDRLVLVLILCSARGEELLRNRVDGGAVEAELFEGLAKLRRKGADEERGRACARAGAARVRRW